MAAEPLRRRFTSDEFHTMAQTGILSADDRLELIEGEIYEMTPIGNRHAGGVNRLTNLFRALDGAVLAVQNPVHLSEVSEPQPDIALLRPRDDFYANAHPLPAEILLLIEVADASLESDRRMKIPLYARYGIPEVWLVDLTRSTLEVHRAPSPSGYRDVHQLRRGDQLSPLAFPDLRLDCATILG
jgi:Uma2 family endonuclease